MLTPLEHYNLEMRKKDLEDRLKDERRRVAILELDAQIRGEQLMDRVAAQHGHAAYVSWGDAK